MTTITRAQHCLRALLGLGLELGLALGMGLAVGCGGLADSPALGGETNWYSGSELFASCSVDAECPNSECVCGVCTVRCAQYGEACAGGRGVCSADRPGERFCDSDRALDLSLPGVCVPAHRCETNPNLPASVGVWTQGELDSLEGCQSIDGDLTIYDNSFFSQPESSAGSLGGQPPTSLGPLEGLTRIGGSLSVSECVVPVLERLQALESIGSLGVFGCDEPIDFTTVEGLTVTQSLVISRSDGVTSLHGLNFASTLSGSVSLSGDNLVDIAALRGVEEVGVLEVVATALNSLDALSTLRVVQGAATVSENPNLLRLDGLSGLVRAEDLVVKSNPELVRLPVFANLAQLVLLEVIDNNSLRQGPGLPLLRTLELPPPGRIRQGTLAGVFISDNPQLSSLMGLGAIERAPRLYVTDNDNLTQLDLAGLRQIENQLTVARNPQLPKSALLSLPAVATPSLNVRGNLGDAGDSDCPWPSDGECDELSGLCSPGTDPDCR